MSTTNENDAGITIHAEQSSNLKGVAEALTGLFKRAGAVVIIGDNDGCSLGYHGLKPFELNQIAEVLMDVAAQAGQHEVARYMADHPDFVLPERGADLPQELADALGRPASNVPRGAINITGMSEEQITEALEAAIEQAESAE